MKTEFSFLSQLSLDQTCTLHTCTLYFLLTLCCKHELHDKSDSGLCWPLSAAAYYILQCPTSLLTTNRKWMSVVCGIEGYRTAYYALCCNISRSVLHFHMTVFNSAKSRFHLGYKLLYFGIK